MDETENERATLGAGGREERVTGVSGLMAGMATVIMSGVGRWCAVCSRRRVVEREWRLT
jgi:hypothetical protein